MYDVPLTKTQRFLNSFIISILEVTIARKVLPHPQGIKGNMRNFLNKGLIL